MQKLTDFVNHLRELGKFEKEKGSPQRSQLPASGSHTTLCDDQAAQVSQDEWGLPKVPSLSQVSSPTELDLPENLPISKVEIRLLKKPAAETNSPMKRPSASRMSLKRPASAPAVSEAKRPASSTAPKAAPQASMARPAGIEKQYKATYATRQSYLCIKDAQNGSKPKLWVAISQKQSVHHQAILKRIVESLPQTKEEAVALRVQFLDAEKHEATKA